MARKKTVEKVEAKDVLPVLAPQQKTAYAVATPAHPETLNKESFTQKMEKIVMPPKSEKNGVKFRGAGTLLVDIYEANPANPEKPVKRSFDVSFGPSFEFTAYHEGLIKRLREKGYKEI